jgi:hypothetical protein
MGIFDRLANLFRSKPPYGPPWEQGQYVTYVLDRGASPSVYLKLSLAQETQQGWFLILLSKEQGVQARSVLLAQQPGRRNSGVPAAALIETKVVDGEHPDPNFQPISHVAIAMNLLQLCDFDSVPSRLEHEVVRSSLGTLECGYFDDPWPEFGYVKRHFMCPDVPITGVAKSVILERNNQVSATSFGCSNSEARWPGASINHLDFGNLEPFEHKGFRLTYPGVWFFLDLTETWSDERRPWDKFLIATHGGNTAAVSLNVCLVSGSREVIQSRLREERELLAKQERYELREEGNLRVFDYKDQWNKGVKVESLYMHTDGTQLANVAGYLLASHMNPHLDALLADAESLLKDVVGSFDFSSKRYEP